MGRLLAIPTSSNSDGIILIQLLYVLYHFMYVLINVMCVELLSSGLLLCILFIQHVRCILCIKYLRIHIMILSVLGNSRAT